MCVCVSVSACRRHCCLPAFISFLHPPSTQKGVCREQIHPKNGQRRFHHAQYSGNVVQSV